MKGRLKVSNDLVRVGDLLPKPIGAGLMRVIETAADFDQQTILYQHTVFCQTCLPYRDPGPTVSRWERTNGNVSMLLTSKEVRDPKAEKWVRLPLPFGPKPRLFLGDINTQAIRRQSPEIDLTASLTRFVKKLNLDPSGRNIKSVKEAIARLCASQIQIALTHGNHLEQLDTQLMSSFDIWFPKDHLQRVLWPSTATLSTEYFKNLMEHAVPLDEDAYFSLSHSALAMDIYAWLAQRLHRISPRSSMLVTWKNLHVQFGWHYDRIRDFRRVFNTALKQVQVAYSAAKVASTEQGLVLRNSPPPVLKIQVLLTSNR